MRILGFVVVLASVVAEPLHDAIRGTADAIGARGGVLRRHASMRARRVLVSLDSVPSGGAVVAAISAGRGVAFVSGGQDYSAETRLAEAFRRLLPPAMEAKSEWAAKIFPNSALRDARAWGSTFAAASLRKIAHAVLPRIMNPGHIWSIVPLPEETIGELLGHSFGTEDLEDGVLVVMGSTPSELISLVTELTAPGS